MNAITNIEGTLTSISVQLGASKAAAGWAEQHLGELQQQFADLKNELRSERAKVRRLEKENLSLRADLQVNGVEPTEVEREEDEVRDLHSDECLDQTDHPPVQQSEVDGAEMAQLQQQTDGRRQILERAFTGLNRPHDPMDIEQEDGDERRAVCIGCWRNRRECDEHRRCMACRDLGLRCVRKLCHGGDRCRRPGCMRLHPEQWDPNDAAWNVEEGRMPEQEPEEDPIKEESDSDIDYP